MKILLVRFKVIVLWLFAVVLMAVHPVAIQESVREVEETEEVKLYTASRQHLKQKPKPQPKPKKSDYREESLPALLAHTPVVNKRPKYIIYCNLIFYA